MSKKDLKISDNEEMELGKMAALRERHVLEILSTTDKPMKFDDIDRRRLQSGNLEVVLSDLAYYGFIDYTGTIPIYSAAKITEKGKAWIAENGKIFPSILDGKVTEDNHA